MAKATLGVVATLFSVPLDSDPKQVTAAVSIQTYKQAFLHASDNHFLVLLVAATLARQGRNV